MITTVATNSPSYHEGYFTDVFSTADGSSLLITFIKHASLLIEYSKKVIYVDPVLAYGDYTNLPKADLILVTHEHYDHLDPKAINALLKPATVVVANKNSCKLLGEGHIMMNGENLDLDGWIAISALPAYNITPDHLKYHPKYRDNGYLLSLGGSRIYISGDTEDIYEMSFLKGVDVAFIAVNQPYTMTISQAVHAAKMVSSGIVYPYHLTDTDQAALKERLEGLGNVDVRMHPMQ